MSENDTRVIIIAEHQDRIAVSETDDGDVLITVEGNIEAGPFDDFEIVIPREHIRSLIRALEEFA